jgi:hypothetical protein
MCDRPPTARVQRPFLFKEQLIYEQSAARTGREQQESDRAGGRANH